MLRSGTDKLDAVVLTHEHNDHIIGVDDVRPFNFQNKTDMPVYASRQVIQDLKKRFSYVFADNPYPGAPRLRPILISEKADFRIDAIDFRPIGVMHGQMPVLGFRVDDFTYITDMKTISEEEKDKVRGTHTLVVNALHHSRHHSHLNLEEALAFIEEIRPQRAYLTHMSHRMGLHEEVMLGLPKHVTLAFDGLTLEVKGE
jgi:phosphoribosyl 1,2-cyclic phosphate phosphodiesterase